MFGVKIRIFKVKESIYVGFKSIHIQKYSIFGHMSAILDFYDLYQFQTYINGFPDLKFSNVDPKHDFLSCIEAEIISFLLKKAAIFIFAIFGPSHNFLRWLPIQT